MCKLVGYDFEIVYHSGKHNLATTALSRVLDILLMALSSQSFQLFDTLHLDNTQNPELLSIQQGLRDDPAAYPGYLYRGGLLFFKGRLVLPTDSSLRLYLLHEFHSSPVGGHSVIAHTFHCLSSNFYWKNIRHDVKVFIASCQICQQMKDHHHHPVGLLQPLPIPEQVFEITMDFVTCLPSSRGKTTIMTVVDRLSKYGHFVTLLLMLLWPIFSNFTVLLSPLSLIVILISYMCSGRNFIASKGHP
uniref:Putative ovule protein n=1 Tax=Solanum chacoense TaxID=4108 RepID=A0A0V0J0A5_SOLCH